MQTRFSKFIWLIHFLGDLVLLNGAFLLAFYIRFDRWFDFNHEKYNLLLFIFNLAWVATVSLIRIHEIHRVSHVDKVIGNLIKAVFIHSLLITFTIVLIKGTFVSRLMMIYSYTIFSATVILWRVLVLRLLKYYRQKGFNYRRVVVAGAGPVGSEVMNFFKSDISYGFHFMGFFDDNGVLSPHKDKIIGTLSEMKPYCLQNKVHEIYVALPESAGEKVKEIIQFAERSMIRVKIVPDFKRYIPKKLEIDFYGSIPVVLLRNEPLESILARFTKRTFDIVFSLLVVGIVFPLLVTPIAILIKLGSPGPVFFRQKRSGKNNHVFNCWKFRTMSLNTASDSRQSIPGDERITTIGRFLRKTNLDELPQFLNVLAGEMSVVGPRPHMLKHTEDYSKIINRYMVRHFIKPGITGWAQVNGYRGATSDPFLMQKRVEYDVWYLENWSFLLDLRIIFLTVINMLKGETNAH